MAAQTDTVVLETGMGLLMVFLCFCLFRFLGRLCALMHIRTILSSVGAHATPSHKLVNLFVAGCEKLGLWMVTLGWVQMLQWNRCSHRWQCLAEMALAVIFSWPLSVCLTISRVGIDKP